jgi:hypothetical protein
VFGCNRVFRDTLLTLESASSLIAQLFWLGFRRKCITYVSMSASMEPLHGPYKKFNYMMDSVFAFTDLPIRLLIRVGGVTTLLATLFGLFVGVARLFGLIAVPGYAMTITRYRISGGCKPVRVGHYRFLCVEGLRNTKARPIAIQ